MLFVLIRSRTTATQTAPMRLPSPAYCPRICLADAQGSESETLDLLLPVSSPSAEPLITLLFKLGLFNRVMHTSKHHDKGSSSHATEATNTKIFQASLILFTKSVLPSGPARARRLLCCPRLIARFSFKTPTAPDPLPCQTDNWLTSLFLSCNDLPSLLSSQEAT